MSLPSLKAIILSAAMNSVKKLPVQDVSEALAQSVPAAFADASYPQTNSGQVSFLPRHQQQLGEIIEFLLDKPATGSMHKACILEHLIWREDTRMYQIQSDHARAEAAELRGEILAMSYNGKINNWALNVIAKRALELNITPSDVEAEIVQQETSRAQALQRARENPVRDRVYHPDPVCLPA